MSSSESPAIPQVQTQTPVQSQPPPSPIAPSLPSPLRFSSTQAHCAHCAQPYVPPLVSDPPLPMSLADLCKACRGRVTDLARMIYGTELNLYAAWPEHVRSLPVSQEQINSAVLALIDAREELSARARCTGQEQPCGNCREPTPYTGDDGPVCQDGKGCAKLSPLRSAKHRADQRARRAAKKGRREPGKNPQRQVAV